MQAQSSQQTLFIFLILGKSRFPPKKFYNINYSERRGGQQSPHEESEYWAVVVAQLVEQSLPIPEVRGSNPVIGKNLFIY